VLFSIIIIILYQVWERGRWLVVLMILQSAASLVLAQFEELIKAHVVIALFLTMLIGSGGNAGGQSVAKAIHEIAVHGHTAGEYGLIKKVLKKQLAVAVWLGLMLGWVAWVRVWVFHGGYENSMAISISCSIIVVSSVLLGALLPYYMLLLGLDEIHSGAVIQVLMDIYGVSVTCLVCWCFWG
jgi:Mg/Co/Ni transporter MgtE